MQPEQEILQDTASALKVEWGLELPGSLSEKELLQLLAQRITAIIQQGAETFFQLMYRLDISERKLNDVLGDEDAAEKIAWLVYTRQLEKIKSRHASKQYPDITDPDLKW